MSSDVTVCLKWSIPTAQALVEDRASKDRRVRDPAAGDGEMVRGPGSSHRAVASRWDCGGWEMLQRVGNFAEGGKFCRGWEILARWSASATERSLEVVPVM